MDGSIAERPKMLFWSENTYNQKKKQNEKRRVLAGSRK
jgi:hypothetical protein